MCVCGIWVRIVVSCFAKKKDSAHDAKLSLLILDFWSRAHAANPKRKCVLVGKYKRDVYSGR